MAEGEKLGFEIPGIYDGICIWIHADGRIENRFTGTVWEGTRRWVLIEAYIRRNQSALEGLAPLAADEHDEYGDAGG